MTSMIENRIDVLDSEIRKFIKRGARRRRVGLKDLEAEKRRGGLN